MPFCGWTIGAVGVARRGRRCRRRRCSGRRAACPSRRRRSASGLVLDDAVGREVEAEVVGEARGSCGRAGCRRGTRGPRRVRRRGRVAAVEDELAARRVGVAVVAALARCGRGSRSASPMFVERRARRWPRGRVAAGGGAVGRGVELAVAGPDQVVRVAHAGGVDRERRAGGERVVRAAVRRSSRRACVPCGRPLAGRAAGSRR